MTWNSENMKSSDQTFSEMSPLNTLDENILNNNKSSIRRQTYTKPDITKDYYVSMDDFFDYINQNKILNICEVDTKKPTTLLPQSDVNESSGYSSLQRKNNNMAYVIGYDTEVSSNSSFSSSSSDPTFVIPGMAIQIDDNEYAVLGTLECDDNFSYKIYTPTEGDKMNFNSQLFETQSSDNIMSKESRKLRKSLSFSTSKTNENFVGVSQDTLSLDSFSTIDEPISTTQSTNDNNTILIDNNLPTNDISTSQNKLETTTCKINHTSSEQHEHELYQNTHHGNTEKVESYEKQENTITNIQKEINKTPSPLFENNGLFMRKEHQIFSQTYSRKVFVGGLPRDVSIDEIEEQFSVFGSVHVDWPNREDEIIPPNGFAFLHFDLAISVMKLYNSVNKYQSKNKYVVSSKSVKNKEVEIKFWKMSDSEILFVDRSWINPRRTVFVGALPRIATAYELADFMNKTFSGVAYAAIDVDLTFGYPKGAGRVTFTSDESYKKALDSHYVEMETKVNSKKKRIEIKPFLLPDQKCDACPSNRISRCANKYCYRCSQFICDNCEQNTYCMDKKRHNVVGRCIDQSQSPYDNCLN